MKRFLIILILCLCLAPGIPTAQALLSSQDLESVQAEFEDFLEALADVLEQRNLLEPNQRQDWIAYQLGDYLQNGGYGTIAIMYSPDLLSYAEPDMILLRLSTSLDAGQLQVETLRAFTPHSSTLPGLPLDAKVTTAEGVPVECRFRWYASSGQLLLWDGAQNFYVSTGATAISEGQSVYWAENPIGSGQESLRLELLAVDSDKILGEFTLQVHSNGQRWDVVVD